ncbi:tRNA (guanine(46)-N(7))-methyltransferase TrmB [Arenibaculum pallidiluteum]|uniref:tRNA (guanine(46)-N(7))-methyltransferase TrmB n=1 Tax=Arenibaculum pallidiluteum TaxID=2812559 RepID=UPI001A9744DE|nr:tRNA (guanine(46)-N(7))-methyltransferase TrmB [Arenibaculum pallidiluteum]
MPGRREDAPAGPLEKVYGRRRGRPLRVNKSRLVETVLPPLRIPRPERGTVLDPRGLFDPPVSECWLEIGFGGGEHLAWQAATHPGIGLIGCEPFVNGVASLLEHVERQDLGARVRILDDDARPLLDALPEASIGRCFVLFPDPWPKARHAERRFIGPANLPRLSRILRDGAELRLASDDPTLIPWMFEHAWRHPDFEWLARGPADWRERPSDWPETRYEQKARAAGRKPVFMRFRRRAR